MSNTTNSDTTWLSLFIIVVVIAVFVTTLLNNAGLNVKTWRAELSGYCRANGGIATGDTVCVLPDSTYFRIPAGHSDLPRPAK